MVVYLKGALRGTEQSFLSFLAELFACPAAAILNLVLSLKSLIPLDVHHFQQMVIYSDLFLKHRDHVP